MTRRSYARHKIIPWLKVILGKKRKESGRRVHIMIGCALLVTAADQTDTIHELIEVRLLPHEDNDHRSWEDLAARARKPSRGFLPRNKQAAETRPATQSPSPRNRLTYLSVVGVVVLYPSVNLLESLGPPVVRLERLRDHGLVAHARSVCIHMRKTRGAVRGSMIIRPMSFSKPSLSPPRQFARATTVLNTTN